MQDVAPIGVGVGEQDDRRGVAARFLEYLPRGNTLDEKAWARRHRLLEWVLLLHAPGLVLLGLYLGRSPAQVGYAVIAPVVALLVGHFVPHRRLASFFITGGLVFCSAALVLITGGTIEAHFHFFIIIGFIALYQDWVPFLWNVVFTTLSHAVGTIWFGALIFNHPAAQANPWLWSCIHGVGVLFACVGMVIFWRITEELAKQLADTELVQKLADAEHGRRRYTSELLVNLARRNQGMLYRQLDIINQLEEKEQDPDALADLFKLDHLATRVRRNAESLLVLAGEQPPRTWSGPVLLRDVVRAAIAETEDLERVVFAVDDRLEVAGHTVADLTHLLAELIENAVRFSPPETSVTLRTRPDRLNDGGQMLTVEDWGVGMPREDLAAANELLASPQEVDLSVSQRLGFHVVARLAARHGITVSLGATPGSGITAVVLLPPSLFASVPDPAVEAHGLGAGAPSRAGTPTAPQLSGWDDPHREGLATTAVRTRSEPAEPATVSGLPLRGGAAGRGSEPADSRPSVRPQSSFQTPQPFADPSRPVMPDGGWQGWWSPEHDGGQAMNGHNRTNGSGNGGASAGAGGAASASRAA
jgi:two-component sensor histidine kinase